jgi:alkane 1-monooxygenase
VHTLTYVLALVPGALTLVGLAMGGLATWLTPAFVFGVIPALELLFTRTRAERPVGRWDRPLADALLLLTVPLNLAGLAVLVLLIATSGLGPVAAAGGVLSVGIGLGIYGLNVGHELGHRGGRGWRLVAQLMMGTALYSHFWVEHNLGHHARVATPDDPASARRGEWIYPFWVRSIVGGARSALALDRRRVVLGWSLQAAALLGVALVLGPLAALGWVGAAVVGILLLETVNYLEHYGLQRRRLASGRYERVQPRHSWNAEHPVGRMMLFDLPRHADHHAHSRRPCTELRYFPDAPQLPTGYPGMVLLALIPPLFCALMDRQLDRVVTPPAGAVEA